MRRWGGVRPWTRLPESFSLFEHLDQLRLDESAEVIGGRERREAAIVADHPDGHLPGRCLACGRTAGFHFTTSTDGTPPNWRETLVCECGLFSRVRAAAEVLHALVPHRSSVYLTERTTALFAHVDARWRRVTASEFMDASAVPASLHDVGGIEVQHQDLTRLSFDDGSFDAVVSMDVLEHIPAYERALREMARVLRPGGLLVLSAPFLIDAPATLVRARHRPDGTVEHLEEPELHHGTAREEGVLAYYHFGWDLLDALRASGFAEVVVARYWSDRFGHLGRSGTLILGRR